MIKTRYEFFKRTHRDYVVIFIKRKNYVVYREDRDILMTLGGRNPVKTLDEFHVNYIIVDELDIVNKRRFEDNQYGVMKKKKLILKIALSCL